MTTPTYTPRAGSLASQVIGFFRHNPAETPGRASQQPTRSFHVPHNTAPLSMGAPAHHSH